MRGNLLLLAPLLAGCAGAAYSAPRLEPLEGGQAPPAGASFALVPAGEAEALLGVPPSDAGLVLATLTLENLDAAPTALARPLEVKLYGRDGAELAKAIPLEDAADRAARASLRAQARAIDGPALLARLEAAAAPLAGELPGGESRRGLVALVPAPTRGAPDEAALDGALLVVRLAPRGAPGSVLVGGRLVR